MKAFVTGATGFIGTHVVKELLDKNWQVIILKRQNSDISEFKDNANVEFVNGDITDLGSLRLAIPTNIDAVFHIAGSVAHLPHHLENNRYAVNVEGTRNIVKICLEKNIGRLIYTSTVLVYDFRKQLHFNESAPFNDWTSDPYMKSKRLAEEEVLKAIESGLDAVILQPSAVFGSFDKATWSKMFLEIEKGLPLPFAPPGGGSICYVRNVASAHVTAFSKGKKGEKYILGGPDTTWLKLMHEIAFILKRKPPKWSLPIPLFKIYGWCEFLLSTYILRREPMLTPHTINILSETVFMNSGRAIKDLNYNTGTVQQMLNDCYEWMLQTKMIIR